MYLRSTPINLDLANSTFIVVLLSQSFCFGIEQNENSSLHRILNQPWIAGIEGQELHPSFANGIFQPCADLPVQVIGLSTNADLNGEVIL